MKFLLLLCFIVYIVYSKNPIHIKINKPKINQNNYQNVENKVTSKFVSNVQFHDEQEITINFINQCSQSILLGAVGPTPLPYNLNLIINTGDTLSFNVPSTWKGIHNKKAAPRFWARTGCKYNITFDKAQCYIGDCNNKYKCEVSGNIPASLFEACFDCENITNTYNISTYDISLVDGYSIPIDISLNYYNVKPIGNYNNTFWCKNNICIGELKSDCKLENILNSSQIFNFNPLDENQIIACFTNCGLYAYKGYESNCNISDINCYNFIKYCCKSLKNDNNCTTDNECDDFTTCYQGKCKCTAYYSNPPCKDNVCTNQFTNPDPKKCNNCIGDDKVHEYCNRAYSWPNDAQTYYCDAREYNIKFCSSDYSMPIIESKPIDLCSNLIHPYNWTQGQIWCPYYNHGNFTCAFPNDITWQCNLDNPNSKCDGILCIYG